jgi:hypothetical protein
MVCSAQFNNKVWALHVRARAEEHGRQSEIQPLGQPHPNTHVLCLCILGSAAPHRCVGAHCKPTVCTCLFRAALSRKKGAHVIVDGQCTRRHTVTELVTACCSGEVQAGTSLAEARRTCRYGLERRYKQNVRCHDLEQRHVSHLRRSSIGCTTCTMFQCCNVHCPLAIACHRAAHSRQHRYHLCGSGHCMLTVPTDDIQQVLVASIEVG